MASYDNELMRQNIKDAFEISGLLDTVASPFYTNRLIPPKPIAGIDQFSHQRGKGDSAYSSFSGGSNVPEYHSPLFCNEHFCLPFAEHLNAEYVKAVYNPNVATDIRERQQCTSGNGHSHIIADQTSIAACCKTSIGYGLPPVPPTRLDSYTVVKNLENSPDPCRCSNHLKMSCDENYQTADMNVADFTADPALRCCKQDSDPISKQENVACRNRCSDLAQITEEKSAGTVTTTFLSQESSKDKMDNLADISRTLYSGPLSVHGYATSATNFLPSSSGNVNHRPTSADSEIKEQYGSASNLCKKSSPSREQNTHRLLAVTIHKQDSLPCVPPKIIGEMHRQLGLVENIQHDDALFNPEHSVCTDTFLESQSNSEKRGKQVLLMRRENTLPPLQQKEGSHSDIIKDKCASVSFVNEASRTHKPVKSMSLDLPECSNMSRKQPHFTIGQSKSNNHIFYYGPSESLLALNTFDKHVQMCNSSTKDAVCESQANDINKLQRQPLSDLANERINKQTTPLLYHLAGESNIAYSKMATNIAKHKQSEKTRSLGRSFRGDCFSEIQQNEKQIEFVRHENGKNSWEFSHASADNQCSDELTTCQGSSDDTFKRDYKKRIKDAQTKVLRLTSFRRKDLQMSLPQRLKENSFKRPPISNIFSFSDKNKTEKTYLKASSEIKYKEMRMSQVSHAGGRKRTVADQKKFCYSEPEKLNHLGISCDQSANPWNKDRHSSTSTTTQSSVAAKIRELGSSGRAVSTSSISKSELKQVQHSAVIQYMERKTAQKHATVPQVSPQKPLQNLSSGNSEKKSVCSGSSGRSAFRPLSASSDLFNSTKKHHFKPSAVLSVNKPFSSAEQPFIRQSSTRSSGKSVSADSLFDSQDLASSNDHARSKSTPSSIQVSRKPTSCSPVFQEDKNYTVIHSGRMYDENIGESSSKSTVEIQEMSGDHPRENSMESSGIWERVQPLMSSSTEQTELLNKTDTKTGHQLGDEIQGFNLSHQRNKSDAGVILPRSLLYREDWPKMKIEDTADPNEKETWSNKAELHKRYPEFKRTLPDSKNSSSESLSVASRMSPFTLSPRSPLPSLPSLDDDVFISNDSVSTEKQNAELSVASIQLSPHKTLCKSPQNESSYVQTPGSPSEASDEKAEDTVSTSFCSSHQQLVQTNEEPASLPSFPVVPECRKPEDERKIINVSVMHMNVDLAELPKQHLDGESSEAETQVIQRFFTSQSNESPVSQVCKVTKSISVSLDTEITCSVDQRYDKLVKEIITRDPLLANVLESYSSRQNTMELMEELFPLDTAALEEYRRNKGTRDEEIGKGAKDNDTPRTGSEQSVDADRVPAQSNARIGTDELLNVRQREPTIEDSSSKDSDEITAKKKKLLQSIKSIVENLQKDKDATQSDIESNNLMGKQLEILIKEVCKPNEYERYMMYIGDLDKVVNLLLCLSSRLARVESALGKVNEATDAEERQSLNSRHSLLSRQREDAKDLKGNLDRRERVVYEILSKYLNTKQLQDFQHFVKVKSSLLIISKELDEKIKFYNEQLEHLQSCIPA